MRLLGGLERIRTEDHAPRGGAPRWAGPSRLAAARGGTRRGRPSGAAGDRARAAPGLQQLVVRGVDGARALPVLEQREGPVLRDAALLVAIPAIHARDAPR